MVLILWIIIFVIVIVWGGIELYIHLMARRSAKALSEEDFKAEMKKAQLIDLREKDIFNAGHILGARNLPYSMLNATMGSLRKDKPIYLYDQKKALSMRAANKLRKNGYTNIFYLKDGYENWQGKIKKKTM
ncbi:rhodanese-like domain-containing protein [Melissococcus plutonius]|uniref:Rhodanese-like domain protein n=1 Tax=Melissococcus plutonius (strain ATCC 35311 / DSM 29964 / CIP 104052 / LMG 20360 / NCIMB 702443) TaxID=940190 RepID=F3Y994_MELPT|nr:rhodanese-like domain-containing protein [Melissococcus plutonius]AIM24646.1 rhodanese-like domain protein [Melissococcus plutonius S1]KMT24743.1 rhodanese-like domain protein [Melissococcus plutonius]KMT26380.1 rhodanese-like domain protein [Melissococcus plutonius]KMT27630.1 rhodanese-like domain protein [Melissococcus plutonius]KMT29402.1 rhodanese-like domain protein [Melissococcus plutonius]